MVSLKIRLTGLCLVLITASAGCDSEHRLSGGGKPAYGVKNTGNDDPQRNRTGDQRNYADPKFRSDTGKSTVQDELSGGTAEVTRQDELSGGTSENKACVKIAALDMEILNQSGLGRNSGYADTDGQTTFSIPEKAIDPKGYFIAVTQDDAGAWINVNGERVLTMRDGHYAAGTWTFNRQNTPISYCCHGDTNRWIDSISGVGNAATQVVQGFKLKPGTNTLTANARDTHGGFRFVGMSLQLEYFVPFEAECDP